MPMSVEQRILRLVIPITGITLPLDQKSLELESDFIIALSDDRSRAYAIFLIPDDSAQTKAKCLSRLGRFLDCFTCSTDLQADSSGFPVSQHVDAQKSAEPPFSQVMVVFGISPQSAKQALFAAYDMARKPLPRHLLNALAFYRRAVLAQTDDEVLLNLVISLESLLSHEVQELRYRLSLRTSYFLGNSDAGLRQQIYDLVHEMYGVRNKIVHSGETTQSIDFVKLTNFRQVVRNAIAKFLELNQSKEALIKQIDSTVLKGNSK